MYALEDSLGVCLIVTVSRVRTNTCSADPDNAAFEEVLGHVHILLHSLLFKIPALQASYLFENAKRKLSVRIFRKFIIRVYTYTAYVTNKIQIHKVLPTVWPMCSLKTH